MDATKIAKDTVTFAVASITSKVASDVITKSTSCQSTDISVKVGTYVLGAVVADYLKPHTNAMVDKTVLKIKKLRNKTTDK